ncbi:MAG: DUF349 domain-containing protein [Paludibacteraceae bacterium]|nr:DUF349 domain-containing protein [Paludibacteraceae bacterium]
MDELETKLATNTGELKLLIEQLKAAVEKDCDNAQNVEVNNLKQSFYKQLRAVSGVTSAGEEKDREEEGNILMGLEQELKSLMSTWHEKRLKQLEQEKAAQAVHLKERQEIIEKIRGFVAKPEEIHLHYNEFKQLQKAWKETGAVEPSQQASLQKEYSKLSESFYDLFGMNLELRDYDFKKNLETKTQLCERAEKLDEVKDVLTAFRALQELHQEWQQTGPVAKEQREELWTRFKTASTIINKKHNDFFENKKKAEAENLQKKTEICEKIEGIDLSSIDSNKAWASATKTVTSLQEEWKTIGYAPMKSNNAIYERYRKACDNFFVKKSEYFKTSFDELKSNLEQKEKLVEQAESLKESEDWKETTEKLVALQKQWKTIGPVPHKDSEGQWRRFTSACDVFFERKKNQHNEKKKEEKENLSKKKAIVEQLEQFKAEGDVKASLEKAKKLIAEFNETGHVPFKEKESLYKRFRKASDAIFDALHVGDEQRPLDAARVRKQIDRLTSDIQTAENNIHFLSPANAKKPNPLIEEMKKNIEKMKEERERLSKRLAAAASSEKKQA